MTDLQAVDVSPGAVQPGWLRAEFEVVTKYASILQLVGIVPELGFVTVQSLIWTTYCPVPYVRVFELDVNVIGAVTVYTLHIP